MKLIIVASLKIHVSESVGTASGDRKVEHWLNVEIHYPILLQQTQNGWMAYWTCRQRHLSIQGINQGSWPPTCRQQSLKVNIEIPTVTDTPWSFNCTLHQSNKISHCYGHFWLAIFLDSTRSIQSNYGEIFIHKRYFFL